MLLNSLKTESFWYRLLFRNRYRLIHEYLEQINQAWESHDRNAQYKRPNGLVILQKIGAADLSDRALRDICWRIIDNIKVITQGFPVNKRDGSVFIDRHYHVTVGLDPNPLHPVLPDEQLRDFLRRCLEHQLTLTPLSVAAYEAGLFMAGIPATSNAAIALQIDGQYIGVLSVPLTGDRETDNAEIRFHATNKSVKYWPGIVILEIVVLPGKLANVITKK